MEPRASIGPTLGARVRGHRGISDATRDLLRESEVIDLHLESFLSTRLFGYDLRKRHASWFPFFGHFFGHVDLPRLLDGGVTGAAFSLATNVSRGSVGRYRVLRANVGALGQVLESTPGIELVTDHASYRAARARGHHAAMLAVQGGNAFDGEGAAGIPSIADARITRVTVVHLSNSSLGDTSSPLRGRRDRGLTPLGRRHVEALVDARIFVDLAHASPRTFWDALDVHGTSQPPIVTHTGVNAVYPMWRNLDDRQVRAIADRGGVIGIIFHRGFLAPWYRGPRRLELVVDHIRAALRIAGEDAVSVGSDLDGAILPPRGLHDIELAFPLLTEAMLRGGIEERVVRKVLGENYLAAFERLRPGR